MASKKPLRDYDEITDSERKIIRQEFNQNYLGSGLVEKWRLTRTAFRQLSKESRL